MLIKRKLTIFIVLAISITTIISNSSQLLTYASNFSHENFDILDEHIIKDVPYIGQETNFYCAYACLTMLLNHFEEINTTLQDVVYYTGVGYSMIYPSFLEKRMPFSGTFCSQAPEEIEFLTSLFGLSRNSWAPEPDSIDKELCWQEYWIRVKQNISNNVPILTSVDPFKLSSFRKIVDLPDFFWGKIPPGGHGIVIVGYNESNKTICYNDPAQALFGHPEYGKYAWMNLTDFNEAVFRTQGSKYVVVTFKKVSEPFSKQEAFNISHARNLEKLRGNLSVYGEFFVDLSKGAEFGINGSKLMQSHFEKGINNRYKTIIIYKLQAKLGILYRLLKILSPIVVNLLDLPPGCAEKYTADVFGRIAIEKSWVADFLNNNSDFSNICEYEAMLFENEAEQWNKISSYYEVFKKKGVFLSLPRAILATNRMNDTMGKIIEIEDAILNCKIK